MEPITPMSERAKAIEILKRHMPEGSTVFYVVRHTTGQTWWISPITFDDYGNGPQAMDFSGMAARVLGCKFSERHGGVELRSTGGMDVGYGLVTDLARALYGDGQALVPRKI